LDGKQGREIKQIRKDRQWFILQKRVAVCVCVCVCVCTHVTRAAYVAGYAPTNHPPCLPRCGGTLTQSGWRERGSFSGPRDDHANAMHPQHGGLHCRIDSHSAVASHHAPTDERQVLHIFHAGPIGTRRLWLILTIWLDCLDSLPMRNKIKQDRQLPSDLLAGWRDEGFGAWISNPISSAGEFCCVLHTQDAGPDCYMY
jgi:hypothetical protein